MSRMGKASVRIVGSSSSESDAATPSCLAGIRRLPDGSLEYRADASDGTARWLSLSSPIRVRALTRDGDNRNWGRLVEVQDADGQITSLANAGRPSRQGARRGLPASPAEPRSTAGQREHRSQRAASLPKCHRGL